MRSLRVFSFVCISLYLGQGCSQNVSVKSLLFETLQPVISEEIKTEKKVVRYCPDNLCLLIESPGGTKSDLLYEFAVMYFFYEADFPEFRNKEYLLPTGVNPRSKFKATAIQLLDRYASDHCADSQDKGICVLRYLREKHGIKTYFSRSDEGQTMTEEMSK